MKDATVIVDRYDENWEKLGWVMLRGFAEILTQGNEHDDAQALLRSRYPQLQSMQIAHHPVIAIRIERAVSWGNFVRAGLGIRFWERPSRKGGGQVRLNGPLSERGGVKPKERPGVGRVPLQKITRCPISIYSGPKDFSTLEAAPSRLVTSLPISRGLSG